MLFRHQIGLKDTSRVISVFLLVLLNNTETLGLDLELTLSWQRGWRRSVLSSFLSKSAARMLGVWGPLKTIKLAARSKIWAETRWRSRKKLRPRRNRNRNRRLVFSFQLIQARQPRITNADKDK
ncbi:hypothetical protein MVEN_00679600 [Mycena venus]|uniref:Uncharacterized protein n=1 Tax=Mycena venus TaxID=2733690 RepID=A0A8H7D4Z9_9AGAR|nr:hypothetical protein MVEN_00679600 [Mycena venus]